MTENYGDFLEIFWLISKLFCSKTSENAVCQNKNKSQLASNSRIFREFSRHSMPRKSCAFVECKKSSRNSPNLRFASFVKPSFDFQRAIRWRDIVGREDLKITRYTFICERHFDPGTHDLDYKTNLKLTPNPLIKDVEMPQKLCVFKSCHSDSRRHSVRFAPFVKPRWDIERAKLWLEKLDRTDIPLEKIAKKHYICELHFPPGEDLDYRTNESLIPSVSTRKVVPDAPVASTKSGIHYTNASENVKVEYDVPNVLQFTDKGLTIHKTDYYDPLDTSSTPVEPLEVDSSSFEFEPILQKPTRTYTKSAVQAYGKTTRMKNTIDWKDYKSRKHGVPTPTQTDIRTYVRKKAKLNAVIRSGPSNTPTNTVIKTEPLDVQQDKIAQNIEIQNVNHVNIKSEPEDPLAI